jgi:uncharacterized protein YnzC (UPF0291/DUF896 family)
MVTDKTIQRINELYRKSKAEGLTKAEAAEQKKLRAEYVAAFRNNLRGTLDSLKIQNPDGSIIDVKKRHEEKMKAQKEAELNNALKNGN